MKILIAEDDPYSRRLLQRRLEKWGHDVVVSRDGLEAWQLFEAGEFPIVISDWMMPGIDGVELVKRIRAANGKGYAYTILLTAKDRKEDLIAGMEAGADEFLIKPFDADELRVRLRAGERIVLLEQSLAERNDELERINRRMKQDLEAAAQIQESLLPNETPALPGLELAWHFKPCDELAGDTLNVFKLDQDHVVLYVLDVSGHGVPAALLSVTLSRMLTPQGQNNPDNKNDHGLQLHSPVSVVNQLNRQFPIDPNTGQFFTLLYGVLNVKSRLLRFVSAGHPDIIHVTADGKSRLISAPGLPIGFNEMLEYSEKVVQLAENDRLLLYSDGLIEIADNKQELFGKQRLAESFRKLRRQPLREVSAALMKEVTTWHGSGNFDDDITMLSLKIST